MAACAACGQVSLEIARFCLACGAPIELTPGPVAEERKTVTVLFCDLVGFTAASDRADPEDVRARIRPIMRVCRVQCAGPARGRYCAAVGPRHAELARLAELGSGRRQRVGPVVSRLVGVAAPIVSPARMTTVPAVLRPGSVPAVRAYPSLWRGAYLACPGLPYRASSVPWGASRKMLWSNRAGAAAITASWIIAGTLSQSRMAG